MATVIRSIPELLNDPTISEKTKAILIGISQLQDVTAAVRQIQGTLAKQERRASMLVKIWIEVKKFIGNLKNIVIEE